MITLPSKQVGATYFDDSALRGSRGDRSVAPTVQLIQFMKGLPADAAAPELSLDDINALVHALRP